METAKNNPIDLMRNDPDFRAAVWNTDSWALVKNARTVRLDNGVMPFWCVLHTVESWSVEGGCLIIRLQGASR